MQVLNTVGHGGKEGCEWCFLGEDMKLRNEGVKWHYWKVPVPCPAKVNDVWVHGMAELAHIAL